MIQMNMKKIFKEESNGEIKISSSEIIMMSFQQQNNYFFQPILYITKVKLSIILRMELLSDTDFKIPKLHNPHKVLQALKKIQFVMEFFVLSKYSKNTDIIAQFLMAIEAFKFYFKMAHFSHQESIYIEDYTEKKQVRQEKVLRPLQKMSQLLEKIKTKPYETYNHQPEQFQELACGKKIQLVTSVKVPDQLRRTKLTFTQLLGQVLSLLRPLLSIIAIRMYGQDNYKSYIASLIIDLFILIILQRNIKLSSKKQVEEYESRKKEIFTRYMFRRPLFMVLKRLVIQPCLKKVISKDRIIYKIIMSILEMQSSITLTL